MALDQRRRVALQALDPQFAEAEGRAAVVAGHQAGFPGRRVDRRLTVHETGAGMVLGQQAGKHLLLGAVPVLLAKRLADRQRPAGNQFLPRFCRDLAVDRDIHRGDQRARSGIDIDAQIAVDLGELDLRREITLGGQDLADQPLQAGLTAGAGCRFIGQEGCQQVGDVVRRPKNDAARRRSGGAHEQKKREKAPVEGESGDHPGILVAFARFTARQGKSPPGVGKGFSVQRVILVIPGALDRGLGSQPLVSKLEEPDAGSNRSRPLVSLAARAFGRCKRRLCPCFPSGLDELVHRFLVLENED